MTTHELKSYEMAKRVCKDIPQALELMKELRTKITPFNRYQAIVDLLMKLNDSIAQAEIHLSYYKKILGRKAEVSDGTEEVK